MRFSLHRAPNHPLAALRAQEAAQIGGKSIDAAGAGATSISPAWLTQLNMLWSGKGVSGQGLPGDAKRLDVASIQCIKANPSSSVTS